LPLHLKGFDQLADQPYFTIDRWQYLPTADQLAQFKQLQDYAQKNRDNGLDVLKSSVSPYIDAFKSYVQKLVTDSLTDVTQAFNLIKNDYTATPIGADIVKLKTTVQALMDLVKNDITFYSNLEQSGNISAASLVIQIGGDVNAINDNINQIKQEITDINNSINTLSATLIQKAKTLSNLLKTKADSLFTAFDTRVLSAVSAGYQTDVAALEYSDKVLKLSLTDLPLSTQLDLNYTGARKAGDITAITKLLIWTAIQCRCTGWRFIWKELWACYLRIQLFIPICRVLFKWPLTLIYYLKMPGPGQRIITEDR